jgi:hypothetical protein
MTTMYPFTFQPYPLPACSLDPHSPFTYPLTYHRHQHSSNPSSSYNPSHGRKNNNRVLLYVLLQPVNHLNAKRPDAIMTLHPPDALPPQTSTPPKPSPKRKRTSSTSISAADSIFAPDIDITVSHHHSSQSDQHNSPVSPVVAHSAAGQDAHTLQTDPLLTGASSPRTVVADKFKNLALRGHGVPALSFGQDGVERKRIKLDGMDGFEEELGGKEEDVWKSRNMNAHTKRTVDFQSHPSSSPEEIPETPQQYASTLPARIEVKSPPPALQRDHIPSTHKIDLSALTWQDSEITGHLALDPDDDGYGINGIGFKPTPAQIYARSQRRRQQVMEWRNREAKEARQRRAEERKVRGGGRVGLGHAHGDLGGGGKGGRVVRFA